MFNYEFTGRSCRSGHVVADAVCGVLNTCDSVDGRVTEVVASKAAALLNIVGFDGGKWDTASVLATVENCTFTKVG